MLQKKIRRNPYKKWDPTKENPHTLPELERRKKLVGEPVD